MIQLAIPVIAVLLPMLLAAAFLLGRHWHRRQPLMHQLSAVTRQHIELFQGGQLSEVAVESAKARFRDLFSRGEVAAVEESLRAGTHFVIHVRALAEIGTDDAGRILERQLQRRLTSDTIEQSWYWIDLANGLRNLNREQSLPHLLRCAEANGDHPLSHFFAAETVCFLSFAGYLRQSHTPLGRAALRVLHRTLEGLRCGLQPQVVIEARLGELIEDLWDHRPRRVSPLIVHVFAEALRLERRAVHAELILSDERYEQEAYGWQISRLGVLEEALREYLSEAPAQLGAQLASAAPEEQNDILRALEDIRGDAAWAILPLLARPQAPHAEQAVNALAWSRDESVGPWLRAWVYRNVSVARRMRSRRLAQPPKRLSVGSDIPYALRASSTCTNFPRRKQSRYCCKPPAIGTQPTAPPPLAAWAGASPSPGERFRTVSARPAATSTQRSAQRRGQPWPGWASCRRCNGIVWQSHHKTRSAFTKPSRWLPTSKSSCSGRISIALQNPKTWTWPSMPARRSNAWQGNMLS